MSSLSRPRIIGDRGDAREAASADTRRAGMLSGLALWCAMLPLWGAGKTLGAPQAAASRGEQTSVAMYVGQSYMVGYNLMRRVAVGDEGVADVAVASSRELLIKAKGAGQTDIYVWDASGAHKISVSVLEVSPAEEAAEKLRPLLGTQYHFRVLDPSTLAIEGAARDQAESQRLRTIIGGMGPEVTILDLVTPAPSPPPPGPPLEQIAMAFERLGGNYKVWAVDGESVAVEGTPRTSAEAAHARALLGAFKTQTHVVDLIQDPPPATPAIAAIEQERTMVADAVGGSVGVRTVGGQAIVMEGTVESETELERIADAVEALGLQAPVVNMLRAAAPDEQQIMVRVKVVEVDRQELKKLGVNWGHLSRTQTGALDSESTSTETVEFFDQPFIFGQVNRRGFNQIFDLGTQLDLLVENDLARILSQPNILVNDGEEASILVGGEVPIPVPQAGVGGAFAITIAYKEFGVRMQVTPTIVGDDTEPMIRLQLTPEVSSIDSSSSIVISGIRVPGFRTRRTTTTVTVGPGDTLAIAGLLQKDLAKNVRKIPILGDIPILGNLFKSKQFTEGTTDLVVMVTPEIQTAE